MVTKCKKYNANKTTIKSPSIATELKKQQYLLQICRVSHEKNAEIIANDVLLISNAKTILSHCHELLDDLASRSIVEFVEISEIVERSKTTITESTDHIAKISLENEELKHKIAFHERCVFLLVLKMNRK
jgi:hypothetical protein